MEDDYLTGKAFYFLFQNGNLLLQADDDGSWTIPQLDQPPEGVNLLNVTPLDGIPVEERARLCKSRANAKRTCYNNEDSASLLTDGREQPPKRTCYNDEMAQTGVVPPDFMKKNNAALSNLVPCPLRQSYYKLPLPLYLKAGKCAELLHWDANSHFCPACGAPMRRTSDISKRCDKCGYESWPVVAVAVIVLIHRQDEVLLVHANNFKSNFYGLVSGFVETGETLEEAVRREVMEETGLQIDNITYFGSQPWPYPSQLMVGFNADYVSGEIKLQQTELSHAEWFTKARASAKYNNEDDASQENSFSDGREQPRLCKDNLPQLPEKLSIARKLIDNWLQND